MGIIKNFLLGIFKKLKLEDYIIVFLCLFLLIIEIKACHKPSAPEVKIEAPIITPVVKELDKNGNKVDVIKQVVYTQSQMDALTDSFRRVLKASKVSSVSTVVTKLEDSNLQTNYKTFYLDTGRHTVFDSYLDSGLYLEYSANFDLQTGRFKFVFTPDTAIFVSTIKKHWFKSDEYKLNIYHTNHYFQDATVAGSSYTYRPPKNFITIGPSFGVFYSIKDNQFKPYLGLGATLNLISIKRKD